MEDQIGTWVFFFLFLRTHFHFPKGNWSYEIALVLWFHSRGRGGREACDFGRKERSIRFYQRGREELGLCVVFFFKYSVLAIQKVTSGINIKY